MSISPSVVRAMSTNVADASVGYLGWSGRSNLGDDVLFEVIADALPEVRFAQLPMSAGELARSGVSGAKSRKDRPLILGGGTAVGRKNWRAALKAATISCGAEHHLVGVGVEDPRFQGLHSFSSGGELQRWRSTLKRFDRVTVRGPNSAALLADIGVEAAVVGDPALLLRNAVESPGAAGRCGALGISLGYGDDLWGHDHARVVDAMAEVAVKRVRDGQEVVFIVVNPDDEKFAKAVAAALPKGSFRFERPQTSAAFLATAAECALVVAERLHAGILAVSAEVPTVMLEYQPKVRDFMDSIDAGDLCVRVDRLSSGGVLDLAARAVADTRQQVRTVQRVAELRARLTREIEILSASVRLRLGLPDLRLAA